MSGTLTKQLKKYDRSEEEDGAESLHPQTFISPILRGGRVLSSTVRHMAIDGNRQDTSLVRTVRQQLRHTTPRSAQPMSSATSPDGMQMTFRQVHITAERRSSELVDSVVHMEEEISSLREQIQRHEQSLASMQTIVTRVQADQVTETRSIERVQRRVHSQRMSIERALQHTQHALQEQSAMLNKQDIRLQRLEGRGEALGGVFLDSVYILVGMYVLQTPLFKYTVRLVTIHLDSSGKNRKWLPRFLQIFFFMHFMNICRSFTRRFSFTKSIWTTLAQSTQSAWKRLSLLTSAPKTLFTVPLSTNTSQENSRDLQEELSLDNPMLHNKLGIAAALDENAKVVK